MSVFENSGIVKRARVFQTLLGLTKIDIASLQGAYEGESER